MRRLVEKFDTTLNHQSSTTITHKLGVVCVSSRRLVTVLETSGESKLFICSRHLVCLVEMPWITTWGVWWVSLTCLVVHHEVSETLCFVHFCIRMRRLVLVLETPWKGFWAVSWEIMGKGYNFRKWYVELWFRFLQVSPRFLCWDASSTYSWSILLDCLRCLELLRPSAPSYAMALWHTQDDAPLH